MNTILHKKHSKRSLFAVLCTFLLCISLTLPVLASAKVDLASIEVANKSEISGDVYDGAGLLSSDQITALSINWQQLNSSINVMLLSLH